jgi:hypothetical protein
LLCNSRPGIIASTSALLIRLSCILSFSGVTINIFMTVNLVFGFLPHGFSPASRSYRFNLARAKFLIRGPKLATNSQQSIFENLYVLTPLIYGKSE